MARDVPDRVIVRPGPLAGRTRVPGDKSLSHRALILGALAGAPVSVTGLADNGDVAATAACLGALGTRVELSSTSGGLAGTVEGPPVEPDRVLDCRNAGTAMRLLAGVAAGVDGLTVLTGDASLRERPMERVAEPLRALGARVDARRGGRLPPLVVRGHHGLDAITHHSPVASAQVKSCVLLAGLAADGPTTVVSPARSRDHTERLLRHLGVAVTTTRGEGGEERVTVRPGPLRPAALPVPGDPSSGAFWLVAAACAGTEVTVPGMGANPTRTGFLAALEQLGADVRRDEREPVAGEPVATVTVGGQLTGRARLDGEATVDSLDELVVLALAGALSDGGLEVVDAAELRVKESDRIATLHATFTDLGLQLEPRDDGYRVPGGQRPQPGVVDARGDHRIAMTACVAGTVAAGPVEVRGMRAVASSYPAFLDDLRALGGHVDIPDPTDEAP